MVRAIVTPPLQMVSATAKPVDVGDSEHAPGHAPKHAGGMRRGMFALSITMTHKANLSMQHRTRHLID